MQVAVVQTHLNYSGVAARHFREQGLDYYNPRFNARVKGRRGGVTFLRKQLFKDYMFVWFQDSWRALRSTVGVRDVIVPDGKISQRNVKEKISQLKCMEDPETGLVVFNKPKFVLGERVQIKSGPFAFERALFDGQRDEDRVWVLFTMLGTTRRMLVDEGNLIAA